MVSSQKDKKKKKKQLISTLSGKEYVSFKRA